MTQRNQPHQWLTCAYCFEPAHPSLCVERFHATIRVMTRMELRGWTKIRVMGQRKRDLLEDGNAPSGEDVHRAAAVSVIGPDHRVTEHPERIVDLLHPRPAIILNTKWLERALAFGFVGGDTVGMIKRALRDAPVEATDWEPACFAEYLFIPELIETCMKVELEELTPEIDKVFITRLLTHPPKDPEVVSFRRAILTELAEDPVLSTRFQKTYRALHRMRALLEPDNRMYEPDSRQQRLETLIAIRDVVECMDEGFASCSSGLARIHEFAAYAKGTTGYNNLTELLDFDNHLADVELRLRIGSDGRIRRLEISHIIENRNNQYYQSPFQRFMIRGKMMLRGYFLNEGELVSRWIGAVYDGIAALLPPLIQLIGEMELYLCAMAFKHMLESKGLSVCFPKMQAPRKETEGEDGGYHIIGLINPLLFSQGITPVPCDLIADKWDSISVVTGPNSGGKTRLLQGIAITQMLAQCGVYIPAKEATIYRAAGLFVSLVEDARADRKEGRLGTELMRIRHLFERSHPGSLVILDELCSGTNPSEGEEIFRLVISLLNQLYPCVFITTHFLQFAARLAVETENGAALRFLQVELEGNCPTFRFIPGVAKTSLAHQTAARLGVTREELLALVQKRRETPSTEGTR